MSEKDLSKPIAQGKYEVASKFENIIITAGMTPRKNGKLIKIGKIYESDVLESYQAAVRLATENALNAAMGIVSENEEISKVLSLTTYINAEEAFEEHSIIANFASDYLEEQLGGKGIGSRAAVGVHSLPRDSPIEIQLTIGIRDK